MKLSAFDPNAFTTAIAGLGENFRTRDLSEHPAMIEAHGESGGGSYHSMVGRYLSANQARLGIRLIGQGAAPRGAHWERTAVLPLPAPSPAAIARAPRPRGDASDLGPQYDRDPAFTARMRFHQSYYRANVLRVACGTGPAPDSARRYGNMLTREDGAAGRNFLTPQIDEVVKRRIAESSDRVEPFRLLHNLLSSQPMCFNLFGPLVVDRERAARLLGALFPGEVARVNEVKIEHAPAPAYEYLDDRTSFDAFIDYERPNGERAFIAVETKLTDSFSPKRCDKPAYRRWMSGARKIWRDSVDERVTDPSHNQVWRNHLLAIALRDHRGSLYVAGRSIVIRHPLDQDGARAVAGYRALLREGDGEPSFGELELDVVADEFEKVATREEERAWLAALRARYVSMESSEAAWLESSARRIAR